MAGKLELKTVCSSATKPSLTALHPLGTSDVHLWTAAPWAPSSHNHYIKAPKQRDDVILMEPVAQSQLGPIYHSTVHIHHQDAPSPSPFLPPRDDENKLSTGSGWKARGFAVHVPVHAASGRKLTRSEGGEQGCVCLHQSG